MAIFARLRCFASLSERRILSKPQNASKLRHVSIIKPLDETPHERLYRNKYQDLQEWNNRYWSENNGLFETEKARFIKETFGDKLSDEDTLTHDQLAPFYRSFLERNRQRHVEYNKIWYLRQSSVLSYALKAKLSRLQSLTYNRLLNTRYK